MGYLGIDTRRVSALLAALRQSAFALASVQTQLTMAQQQAEFPIPVALPLDQIERDLLVLAATIERAVHEITSFRTPFGVSPFSPRLPRSPRPAGSTATERVRWNAEPALRWNEVRQESSHNTYGVAGGVAALYDVGVRSFELDIHRGAPTDLDPPGAWFSPLSTAVAIVADHFDHAGGRPDDWRVYHSTGDEASEYEYLSDGLAAVAALPVTDPVTVFVDVKDDFGGTHTAGELSRLVSAALGERLFTPTAMRHRSPGARSLPEVVASAGWPHVDELQGAVFVVVTGDVASTPGRVDESFFRAPPPQFVTLAGQVTHVPDSSAVFYNANQLWISDQELAALHATSSVTRTYFNRRCAAPSAANYRAIDITPTDTACPR